MHDLHSLVRILALWILIISCSNNFSLLVSAQSLQPTPTTLSPLQASPSTSTPTITPAPANILQQNSACLILGEALAICQSITPDFTALDATQQASCLCYSGTSWQPDVFDTAVSACADFAATAVGGVVQGVIGELKGFCESVGDVVFTTAMGSETVTEVKGPSSTVTVAKVTSTELDLGVTTVGMVVGGVVSTGQIGAVISSVLGDTAVSEVPSVGGSSSTTIPPPPPVAQDTSTSTTLIPLPPQDTSTLTQPQILPTSIAVPPSLNLPPPGTSTLQPSSIIPPSQTAVPSTTLPPSAAITPPPPVQLNTQACILFSSILSTCTEATTSFITLALVQQASCLCYVTGLWVPNAFDGAVNGCWNSVAGVYSTVGGFCAGIKNGPTTPLTTNISPLVSIPSLSATPRTSVSVSVSISPPKSTLLSLSSTEIITSGDGSASSTEAPAISTSIMLSITSILVVPLPMSIWTSTWSSTSSSPSAITDENSNILPPAALSSLASAPASEPAQPSPPSFTIIQIQTLTSTSSPTTTFLEISPPSSTAATTTKGGLSQVLDGLGDNGATGNVRIVGKTEVVVVSAGLALLVTFL